MLTAANLTKSYGDRTLFEDVSFSLVAQERLGLVGRNGSGKSTLFRIILGEESPDQGSIVTPRGYRIGHLSQHLQFTQPTILREACLGLPADERDQEYRGEIILSGLGFTQDDLQRAPAEFSGGFQIRLNLAKLFLSEPNLLLLDEPTNYLDIVSMRWLTSFLRAWKGELMLISHDRLFMDSVTTHTMFIHRARIRKVQGDTAKLYAQVAQEEEIYEKTRVNEDKKRRDLEVFISRFRAQASKAALVQSKMKALERMGEKDELSDKDRARPQRESTNQKDKQQRSTQRKIAACEERFHKLETELLEVESDIARASEARETQAITERSARLAALKNSIDAEFQNLEKLSKMAAIPV